WTTTLRSPAPEAEARTERAVVSKPRGKCIAGRPAFRPSESRLDDFERRAVRVGRRVASRPGHVHLERAADPVARGILEDGQDHQAVRAGDPGSTGPKGPTRVSRLEA